MPSQIICTVGTYDMPVIQQQPPFKIDLLKSNIALFGSSMSGKTNFLKLIINNLHKKLNEENERIFILDFSGGLLEYKQMPLVAAYFDNSNEEYVKRVFKILETILKDNIKMLGSKSYSATPAEAQPVHTTFIIDNLNSFVDESRYAAYHDKFGRLCREGRSRGISIVFTASDTKGVSRFLLSFEQKIALNFPNDKYAEIFGEKAEAIGKIIGRGYANVTERPTDTAGTFNMNSPYEFQCFKASEIQEENNFIKNLRLKYGYNSENSEIYQRHAKKYLTFSQELTYEEYEKLRQPLEDIDKKPSSKAIAVGLDYVDFKPVFADADKSNVWAIYGKKEFGKTNLLSVLLDGLAEKKSEAKYVFFDDGRKQLKDFYDDFNQKGFSCEFIDEFSVKTLTLADGTEITRKLSPMQQFYRYIHEETASLGDYDGQNVDVLEQIYGRDNLYSAPIGADKDSAKATVFVIQSKSVFLGSKSNSPFIRYILPELLDIAEESGFIFIFTDVKKITDAEMNAVFNSTLKTVFLLDNIAEFASERGSKSVFGDMDVKALKEDYARCELGDGYCYDVEADSLKKMKFIYNKK